AGAARAGVPGAVFHRAGRAAHRGPARERHGGLVLLSEAKPTVHHPGKLPRAGAGHRGHLDGLPHRTAGAAAGGPLPAVHPVALPAPAR
nr:hypothetical protein [Tanacetum cinerariifolium]